MDDTDLGTLTREGDRWMLTFTRRLAHPREKVWRAVTEPAHLAAWYPQEIVGERRAGAPLRFVSSAGDGFDGQMLVFDPPEVTPGSWRSNALNPGFHGVDRQHRPHRYRARAADSSAG